MKKKLVLLFLLATQLCLGQNLKISQLPVATTPLGGNELVPVVQGGVTKQVAASWIGNTYSGGSIAAVTGQFGINATTIGQTVYLNVDTSRINKIGVATPFFVDSLLNHINYIPPATQLVYGNAEGTGDTSDGSAVRTSAETFIENKGSFLNIDSDRTIGTSITWTGSGATSHYSVIGVDSIDDADLTNVIGGRYGEFKVADDSIIISHSTNGGSIFERWGLPIDTGAAGQVLTSQGNKHIATWTTPTGASLTATYIGYGSNGNTVTGDSNLLYIKGQGIEIEDTGYSENNTFINAGNTTTHVDGEGFYNIGIGGGIQPDVYNGALISNVSGQANIAIGVSAMASNINGNNNTAVGNDVLDNNTSGSGNTAIGNRALGSNATGSDLVAIGNNIDLSADGLNNSIGLGNGNNFQIDSSNSFIVDPTITRYKIAGVTYYPPTSEGATSTVLTNDGSGNLSWTSVSGIGGLQIDTITDSLTNAQMATIESSPIELIPAPGARQIITVNNITESYHYNGTMYSTGDLIYYTLGVDSPLFEDTRIVGQNEPIIIYLNAGFTTGANAFPGTAAASPLMVYSNVNQTALGGTIYIHIQYTIDKAY